MEEISVNISTIQAKIYQIRGVQVMLDRDLATFYDVETGQLNRQVKRNANRFPDDFMFQLTNEEWKSLKCQIGISNTRGGDRRSLPYVFTEQGVSQLSGVLRSDNAVEMSVKIIRAFVAMRRFITANANLFQRLSTLELKQLNTDEKLDKVLNRIERYPAYDPIMADKAIIYFDDIDEELIPQIKMQGYQFDFERIKNRIV